MSAQRAQRPPSALLLDALWRLIRAAQWSSFPLEGAADAPRASLRHRLVVRQRASSSIQIGMRNKEMICAEMCTSRSSNSVAMRTIFAADASSSSSSSSRYSRSFPYACIEYKLNHARFAPLFDRDRRPRRRMIAADRPHPPPKASRHQTVYSASSCHPPPWPQQRCCSIPLARSLP